MTVLKAVLSDNDYTSKNTKITLSGCRSDLLRDELGQRLAKQRHYRTRRLCEYH